VAHEAVLNEAEARDLIVARLGADPGFVASRHVHDIDEAREAAHDLTYPVTLKGAGPGLAHKARFGAVVNDIRSDRELVVAGEHIADAAGARGVILTGFLVQPYERAGTDLILAGVRDPIFGVCVMLAHGGGSVESATDIRFLLAADVTPLKLRAELEGLLDDTDRIRLTTEQHDRLAALAQGLVAVLDADELLRDVELNPVRLVWGHRPRVSILDALATRASADERPGTQAPSVDASPLTAVDLVDGIRRALRAEHVGLVGVSRRESGPGYGVLRMLRAAGYEGRITIVHPSGGVVHGIEALHTLAVDEVGRLSFDVVVLSVAEEGFAEVIEQLADHDVGAVIGMTSSSGGGSVASRRMERAVITSTHPVVGPNTAGFVAIPNRLRASFARSIGMEAVEGEGNIAYVTQSGSVGSYLLARTFAERLGLRYWVPTGNELAVRLDHVLGAVCEPGVAVVGLYIEGVRHGAALIDALRAARANGTLVVAYPVGSTAAGRSAAQSHTAAMAGDHALLRHLLEREGVLVTDDMSELFDLAKLGATTFAGLLGRTDITALPVIALSTSGGSATITAEEFGRYGQPLAPLEPMMIERLGALLPSYATSANPVDVSSDAVHDPTVFIETLEAVAAESGAAASERLLYLSLGTQGGDTAIDLAERVVELHRRHPMRLVVSRLGEPHPGSQPHLPRCGHTRVRDATQGRQGDLPALGGSAAKPLTPARGRASRLAEHLEQIMVVPEVGNRSVIGSALRTDRVPDGEQQVRGGLSEAHLGPVAEEVACRIGQWLPGQRQRSQDPGQRCRWFVRTVECQFVGSDGTLEPGDENLLETGGGRPVHRRR